MLSKIHLAITLGGDGTIISRARMLLGYEIPLLGVNLGRLGYLAQVEPDALAQAVEHVIAGRYSVEHRILLEGQVWTEQGQVKSPFTAFNEALIHRSTASKLLRIRVGLNGGYFERFLADGILWPRPRAARPITFPQAARLCSPRQNLVVTAVCPHSVAARSIVTAEGDDVQLTVEMGEGQQAPVLVIDGAPHCQLCPGDCVQARRSRQQLEIVRLPGQEPAQSKLFQ